MKFEAVDVRQSNHNNLFGQIKKLALMIEMDTKLPVNFCDDEEAYQHNDLFISFLKILSFEKYFFEEIIV